MEGTRSREAAALVGRTFGEFVVREPLSSGGFGLVFRAEQPALARQAVIKVLHMRLLGSETVVQRFLREARLASRLDHPYAAHTYAFGAEPDGVLWIAMELVRGTPLDRMLVMQGPIPLDRFVPLLERICEVVHTAHEQGIVHRDLKPGNVMVLARAGRLLPKLLDFGIAKIDDAEDIDPDPPSPVEPPPMEPAGALDETIDPAAVFAETADVGTIMRPSPPTPVRRATTPTPRGSSTGTDTGSTGRLTLVGATMGSPLYMAPEQWSDAGAVGPPTDLYALGVLCYESLTGRLPFRGDSNMQIALAHARQPVPPLGPDFPRELDLVLARVLAKNPGDRYADALEFAAAFRSASGISADPASLPRLDELARDAAVARAYQPLARAVAALDSPRNAHQARDALWQVVRVAVRLLGVASLAGHSHVRSDLATTDPSIGEALRRLRSRSLGDAAWLELARELVAGFAQMRDAHPIPELVDFLTTPASDPLDELLRLRAGAEEAGGGTEEMMRELLQEALPHLARLLDRLSFLSHYQLAVPDGDGADVWVGVRREQRPRRRLPRTDLPHGRPLLLDPAGAPVVALWPFVQVHVPAPGEPPALFFIEGRGRRGARLVALPDPFERDDEQLWEALGGMLGDTSEGDREGAAEEACPFPGLASYSQSEAGSFFGRERESEAFLNRLRVTPLLAVVGPSGAGKSSFVQAGVLPGLPEGWQSVTVRPGSAPLVSLVARLASAGVDAEASGIHDHSSNALGSVLRASAASRGTTIVVVVDQLEELFTLCDDAGERERYAETLVRFARSPDDPVRVILTLRDDFLLRAEGLAAFRSRLAPALQLVATPAPADLKRILVEPLRRAGYDFDDPGLPDEMIEAVAGAPSALALLSFTASKLWELRDRRFHQIGHKAYRSLGGVGGALAQHAEAVLTAMRPEEQRLVREVFRHAVTAEGTRAVLSRSELDDVLGGAAAASSVVEKLVAARLLVISESESGGERVEVTHEALLDAWPRLVTWRREDAEGARLRDQLRAAARQWEERGRPSGLLWRGDALAEYRLWRARYPGSLTAVEEAFAAATLADAARSRKLRRILLAGIIASLLAVAVVLFVQNTRVERQRIRAVANEKQVATGAAKMHDLLLDQYESQGRRLLLADDPVQALAYLYKAAQLGAKGPAHDFLVAQAVRATDGERFVVQHDSGVVRVRFAPDGSRLATAGYDKRARIWNLEDGALLFDLAHEAPVTRVEWSPDGALLATADRGGTLALWDPSTGRRRYSLSLSARPQEIAFSQDGARLVAALVDESVTLWNPATGERVAVLREPTGAAGPDVGSVAAVSPDSATIAVGDVAGTVHLWDGHSGRALGSLSGQREPIVWLRFSTDGRRLVTTSETRLMVWNLPARKALVTLPSRQPLTSAAFSPDGTRVVSSSADGTATVWAVATGEVIRTLAGHRAAVEQALFSPDGSQVATASADGTSILWEAANGRRLARRFGHRGMLRDVVFDSAGRLLATASADGSAIVSSAEPVQRVTFLAGHQGGILWVELSPGGSHALTASTDGTARIWDAATGRELMALSHPTAVSSARFSPDGERIATGAGDGIVRIWDARSGARRAELRGHTGAVLSLAWDRSGARLVSASNDGSVRVWAAATGKSIQTLRPHAGLMVYGANFTASGDVITTGADDTIRLVEASGRELKSFLDRDGRQRTSLARSGALGVSATFNRSAKVWSLADGGTRIELLGHVGDVAQAEWSPDDVFIVTASADATARIWEARTGHLLAVLDHQGEWVLSADYSPDGGRVVTGRGDGVAAVWELPRFSGGPEELGRIVRCRVPYALEDEDTIVPRPRDLEACGRRGDTP